jgi:hypothetical protein
MLHAAFVKFAGFAGHTVVTTENSMFRELTLRSLMEDWFPLLLSLDACFAYSLINLWHVHKILQDYTVSYPKIEII